MYKIISGYSREIVGSSVKSTTCDSDFDNNMDEGSLSLSKKLEKYCLKSNNNIQTFKDDHPIIAMFNNIYDVNALSQNNRDSIKNLQSSIKRRCIGSVQAYLENYSRDNELGMAYVIREYQNQYILVVNNQEGDFNLGHLQMKCRKNPRSSYLRQKSRVKLSV